MEEEKTKGLKRLKSLRLIFSFMFRHKALLLGAMVALFVSSGALLTIFRSLQWVIDDGFGAQDIDAIRPLFLNVFYLILVMAVATFFRFMFITTLGERVVADIRTSVHTHLLGLSPAFFETNRPSELASRLTADTTLIQSVAGSSLSVALRNIVQLVGAIVILLIMSPGLIFNLLLGALIIMVPLGIYGRRVRALSKSSQDRVADVGTMASEAFGAIQVVQAFTREREESSRFSNAVEAAYAVAKKRILARSWLTAIVIVLGFGLINYGLWRGAQSVVSGGITGGELATFMGMAFLIGGSIAAMGEVYADLQRAAGAAHRITEILSTAPDLPVVEHPAPLPHPFDASVVFENLSFSYPSKPGIWALDGFDLSVAPGETVAIVGPSGAGKSTVLQLLLRFFDPQAGRIIVDGIDIRDVDPRELRGHMAFVPQDTIIFADTVEANTRFGRPDATDAEVRDALEAALCSEFVHALPDGMNTYLGERGVRLSGGQRQRLAIARAILRDAPILLLDEATSALDSEAERKVQQALDELMKSRTTIVIAHRLSTVRKADRIIVLEDGKIVASGKHEQLMEEGGLYARLAKLQFTEAI